MNLKSASVKRLRLEDEELKVVMAQALNAPELIQFVEKLLLDKLSQVEEVSADDPNWIIKRAMKDGRQSELKSLYNILCEE